MAENNSNNAPELSVVLPCYNESTILPGFIKNVIACTRQTGLRFEVIAVNDGSSDETGSVLDQLEQSMTELKVLHFSRNFGHMAALTAGLDSAAATGAVITMDSDGQHPPEMIPDLVSRWKAGADIVQTIRRDTSDATFAKRVTSMLFYYTLNRLGDTPVMPGAADFRLMNREAVDALATLPEKARFVRGLVFWIGFRMEVIEFDAPARLGGTTKYSFGKMLRFAVDGITGFSTVLLRISMLAGLLAVLFGVLYGMYVIFMFIFYENALVSGWSSLMLVVLFLGGLNLISIGILGEYIGRIYSEVKNRPLYILRKKE